jgi:hypothetical protein
MDPRIREDDGRGSSFLRPLPSFLRPLPPFLRPLPSFLRRQESIPAPPRPTPPHPTQTMGFMLIFCMD